MICAPVLLGYYYYFLIWGWRDGHADPIGKQKWSRKQLRVWDHFECSKPHAWKRSAPECECECECVHMHNASPSTMRVTNQPSASETSGSSIKRMLWLPLWTHMENILKLLSVFIIKCRNIPWKTTAKAILHVWSETFITFSCRGKETLNLVFFTKR